MVAIMMGVIMIVLFLFIGRKELKSAIVNGIKNPPEDLDDKVVIPMLLFIITILLIYVMISNLTILDEILENEPQSLYDKLILGLTSISLAIFINVLLSKWIQKLNEKMVIRKFEKKHRSKEYDYYRDILQEKSPAILSYCYNPKINIEDNIVAIILNLQMQNIIKIENNTIKVIGDISNLKEHEEFILKQVQKPRYNEHYIKEEFQELLIKDLKKEKYIYEGKGKKTKVISTFEGIMGMLFLYLLITSPIWMKASKIGILAYIAYALNFYCMFQYKKIEAKENPNIRKEKTLELAGKLRGMKRYIKNYSLINENGVENINLYNEYIIYAIILNIKGKLNNECKKIYRDIKEIIMNNEIE